MLVKEYKGQTLYNVQVTYKIDGVRVHRTRKGVVSRDGKPLHNVPTDVSWEVAEVYLGDWERSVSAVRTHGAVDVPRTAVYSILPTIDARLHCTSLATVTAPTVKRLLHVAVKKGYEGLVLRAGNGLMFKVKPVRTFDVPIEAVLRGKDGTRLAKTMGSVMTPKGKVGAGFTDADRERVRKLGTHAIGLIIEVACMRLTPSGKFREPRFVRFRPDKPPARKASRK